MGQLSETQSVPATVTVSVLQMGQLSETHSVPVMVTASVLRSVLLRELEWEQVMEMLLVSQLETASVQE